MDEERGGGGEEGEEGGEIGKVRGNDFHSLFCGDDVLSCQNILPPQRERNLGKSDTASESG